MNRFDYHAWATRHVSGKKRRYSIKEHLIYGAVSAGGIAACVALLIWAATTLGQALARAAGS